MSKFGFHGCLEAPTCAGREISSFKPLRSLGLAYPSSRGLGDHLALLLSPCPPLASHTCVPIAAALLVLLGELGSVCPSPGQGTGTAIAAAELVGKRGVYPRNGPLEFLTEVKRSPADSCWVWTWPHPTLWTSVPSQREGWFILVVGSVSSDKGSSPQGAEWAWWRCPPPSLPPLVVEFRPEALLGRPPRIDTSCFLMCFSSPRVDHLWDCNA